MSRVPDVVILCGGAGVRLKSITGDSPKPMATIAGRPFLELLLGQLERYGFSRVILSAGYKHQAIREHFGEQAFGLELVYSVEESPLGTGGALAQAADDITTDVALIMNGDSYAAVDLSRLVEAHRKDDATDGTVVVMAETRSDAGSVLLDENGRVVAFAEKSSVLNTRYQSAGIYTFHKKLLSAIPRTGKISLEEQLFPEWLASGRRIDAFVFSGECVDIGTPERYQKAQNVLAAVEREANVRREGQS
ncbi:MAG: nucleotidyltransferase family protein [Candidatus Acidiferrales bacterium]